MLLPVWAACQWRRKVFSSGETNQFARAPESAGPPLGAERPLFLAGPLERMKGPEFPSDEKELPNGPPDGTEENPELPGLPERMALSSKHVRRPL